MFLGLGASPATLAARIIASRHHGGRVIASAARNAVTAHSIGLHAKGKRWRGHRAHVRPGAFVPAFSGFGLSDTTTPPAGYTWTDADGVVHYPVDDIANPDAQRIVGAVRPTAKGWEVLTSGLPTWAKVAGGLAIAGGAAALLLRGRK